MVLEHEGLRRHCRGCCAGWWSKVKERLPSKRLAKIYFTIFINVSSTGFQLTMLFPYMPFLLEFLIPHLQEDHQAVGKYAGVMGGALPFGRIFGCYMWGVLADRKGRKPIILVSNILGAISTVAFGFSVNFAMAVVTRVLMGFTSGIVAASKAVVSEVTDDKNQAVGINIIGAAWGIGYILGPATAAAVADPIGQYSLNITNPFLHGLLTRFPYCLPAFVSTLITVFAFIMTLLFLPETLGTKKNRRRSEINKEMIKMVALKSQSEQNIGADNRNGDATAGSIDIRGNTRLLESCESQEEGEGEVRTHCIISNPAVSEDLGSNVDMSGVNGHLEESPPPAPGEIGEHRTVTSEHQEEGMVEEGRAREEGEEEGGPDRKSCLLSFCQILKATLSDIKLFLCNGPSLNALLIYCIYAFGTFGFDELYSLWAFTRPHYGGLGFSLHEIGLSLTIVGVLILLPSFVTFPFLEKRLKAIKTFYAGVIPLIFLVLILPNIHYLVSTKHVWLLWGLLILIVFIIQVFFSVGYSSIFFFINNSVTFDKLGSINGLAMTMNSISRTISPLVLGALYSVSLSEAASGFGYPVDYHLVFILISMAYLISVCMVACMPRSINYQKIIEDV